MCLFVCLFVLLCFVFVLYGVCLVSCFFCYVVGVLRFSCVACGVVGVFSVMCVVCSCAVAIGCVLVCVVDVGAAIV